MLDIHLYLFVKAKTLCYDKRNYLKLCQLSLVYGEQKVQTIFLKE